MYVANKVQLKSSLACFLAGQHTVDLVHCVLPARLMGGCWVCGQEGSY